jgi:GH24 family phage-related lysozyme (muramidase)
MNRKPVFDAVRALLGRSFRPAEVAALDRAIDAALAEVAGPRRIGPQGTALIQRWEGCAKRRGDGRFEAYPDPGSADGHPWTIGWGATGPDVTPGTIWTPAECDARLDRDLARYAAEVAGAIGTAPTTPHQFDALVSFHYNTGAIAKATLTRRHIAGDFAAACAEFGKWIHNDGKVLRGLVRRRAEEAELYGRFT